MGIAKVADVINENASSIDTIMRHEDQGQTVRVKVDHSIPWNFFRLFANVPIDSLRPPRTSTLLLGKTRRPDEFLLV